MNAEEVKERLRCSDTDCRCQSDSDSANVHCPAHHDPGPSLSINDGDTVALVFKCFAGCEYDDIVEALEADGIYPYGEPDDEDDEEEEVGDGLTSKQFAEHFGLDEQLLED